MIRKEFVKCERCGEMIEWNQYNYHISEERKKAEKEVLSYIRKEKLFTTREIAELTKLPISQVRKLIEKLHSEGLIENISVGIWRLNE